MPRKPRYCPGENPFHDWMTERGFPDYTLRIYFTTQIGKYLKVFSPQELVLGDIDQIILTLRPNSSKRMIYNHRKAIMKYREFMMCRGLGSTAAAQISFVEGD